ncbi:MAG: cytochrome c maturation protein CcmE [Methanoregulaceae archaeon]|nr:cytochrome c maturation protein CcmE [Methanoregulaceae archaeon]
MRQGALISGVVALVATVGLTTVFVQNASPYVTIKEAAAQSRDVHVVGQLVPGSLSLNTLGRETRFVLKDETGEIPVVYTGPPQSNLASATQVVVIGYHENGSFHSKQMLVKCPSKYESEKDAASKVKTPA